MSQDRRGEGKEGRKTRGNFLFFFIYIYVSIWLCDSYFSSTFSHLLFTEILFHFYLSFFVIFDRINYCTSIPYIIYFEVLLRDVCNCCLLKMWFVGFLSNARCQYMCR